MEFVGAQRNPFAVHQRLVLIVYIVVSGPNLLEPDRTFLKLYLLLI